MVQEANVKRAQAEKALAESEMKVRSNLPCGEVWLGEVWCRGPGVTQAQLADTMMTLRVSE